MHELLKKVANPDHFSVLWYYMHKNAYNATTYQKKEEFERFLISLINDLPCNECKKHATKYVSEHPIRNFFNLRDERSGAEIGVFKYTWIFHNDVNRRLKKSEVDWFTALSMYSSSGEGCDNCGIQKKEDDKKKKYHGKH